MPVTELNMQQSDSCTTMQFEHLCCKILAVSLIALKKAVAVCNVYIRQYLVSNQIPCSSVLNSNAKHQNLTNAHPAG